MSVFDKEVFRLQSGDLPPELWERVFDFVDCRQALVSCSVCFEFAKRLPRHITALGLRVPADVTLKYAKSDRKYRERFSLARFWQLQYLRVKQSHGPGVGFVAARLREEPSVLEKLLAMSAAFSRVTVPSACEVGRTLSSGFCTALRRLDLTGCALSGDALSTILTGLCDGGVPCEELLVGRNRIGDDGGAYLGEMLRAAGSAHPRSIPLLTTLRVLDVRENGIGHSGGHHIAVNLLWWVNALSGGDTASACTPVVKSRRRTAHAASARASRPGTPVSKFLSPNAARERSASGRGRGRSHLPGGAGKWERAGGGGDADSAAPWWEGSEGSALWAGNELPPPPPAAAGGGGGAAEGGGSSQWYELTIVLRGNALGREVYSTLDKVRRRLNAWNASCATEERADIHLVL